MESGETLLKKLDGKLSGLRGRLTADAGMDKITWFRAGAGPTGLTRNTTNAREERD